MRLEEFNWNDREIIVVPKQDAVAVYPNPQGAIVIRQEDEMDTDQVIIVQPDAARALAAALVREADEIQSVQPVPNAKPKYGYPDDPGNVSFRGAQHQNRLAPSLRKTDFKARYLVSTLAGRALAVHSRTASAGLFFQFKTAD